MTKREKRERRNQELYERLKVGDGRARDALIIENMELCDALARKFVRRSGDLDCQLEDVIATAYGCLVSAANLLVKKSDVGSVTAWMSTMIMRTLIEYSRDEDVGPGRSAYSKRKQAFTKKYELLETEFASGQLPEGKFLDEIQKLREKYDESAELVSCELSDEMTNARSANLEQMRSFRERIVSFCRDAHDERIIDLRLQCYTYEEIAVILSTSKDAVQRRVKAIEKAYLDDLPYDVPKSRTKVKNFRQCQACGTSLHCAASKKNGVCRFCQSKPSPRPATLDSQPSNNFATAL